MRKSIIAALAGVSLAIVGTPAAAQDSNRTRDVLGRILNVILGPTEQPKEEVAPGSTAATRMAAVLADPRRDGDRARDAWRHPSETLAFFQVQPGMTVVDYMPAGGWYTRILAPYLGREGLYLGMTPDPRAADSDGRRDYFAKLPGDFRSDALRWSLDGAPVAIYASQDLPAETRGTVDRVLVFREMHNILRSGVAYAELTRIRDLLKADGLLGIVQHRARADAPADYALGANGYLREQDVIKLVEAHGFELVGTSEINANAADPANHPRGVWELPPSRSTKRDELNRIGESDRMTLLFRKRA